MPGTPSSDRSPLRPIAWSAVISLVLALALVSPQGATARTDSSRSVAVTGDVGSPARYSRTDLAGLPQVTLLDERSGTGGHPHTVTGVSLQSLILASTPSIPDEKNAGLRVTARVSGAHHRSVAVALGELDPSFGNHPALLVLARDGRPVRHSPALAFPGDTDHRRTVGSVARIDVTVVSPTLPSTYTPGSLRVRAGHRTVILSAAELSSLPARTRTVTFTAGTEVQTHTETGPSLRSVLRAAHLRPTSTTTVAALGDDGYVAAVTPGETSSGGRPLQVSLVEDGVSLTEPRLVVAGDVKGGRYVSGLIGLEVSGADRR